MTKQHLTEQEIAQAAEALTSGRYHTLDESLKTHLTQCDDCADEVQMVSELVEGESQNHSKPRRRILPVRIGIAATVAIAISVIWLLHPGGNETLPLAGDQNQQDSIKQEVLKDNTPNDIPVAEIKKEGVEEKEVETIPVKKAAHDKNLVAFQSHAELEALVKRFEDGALRGEGLKVISASTIEEQADFLTLCWENPDNEEVILEFFSNKGYKLYEDYSDGNSYHPKKLTTPGLYYWKMLNEDFDLVFCGRIKLVE